MKNSYTEITPTHKLKWYEEVACWIGAMLVLPFTIPLMLLFIVSAVALWIYSRINDGLGN